jgi:hypothetical protein
MAKRNLDLDITDFSGKPMTMDNTPNGERMTLKSVCQLSCLSYSQDGSDNAMSMQQKLRLHALGRRLHDGGVQDFTSEDITLIKERICKIFVTMAAGQACALLEQDWIAPVVEMPAPTLVRAGEE